MSSSTVSKISINPVKYIKSPSIKPLVHQKLVIKYLLSPTKGLLIFHSTGSGKTLTALLSIKELLKKFPDKKVVIITPASLVSNFEKELQKVKLNGSIKLTSYVKFVNEYRKAQEDQCRNTIFVIDECHHFGRKGVLSSIIKKCAKSAFKVILLSATPITNSPEEMINLLYMITGYFLTERDITERFNRILRTGNYNEGLLNCKVSIFKNNDTKNYPTSKEFLIKLTMSPEYYIKYLDIQENYREDLPEIFQDTKDLEVFLNGVRRGVNTLKIVSPKIEWVISKVKEGEKTVVYSNWKGAGIELVKKELKEQGIPFGEVSGSVLREKKDKSVKDYNENKIKVLLITSSGAEGLDLKATRNVIILENHWNYSRLEQVIGRAVRYKSHEGLPLKDRHVNIYYLTLSKPEKRFKNDKLPSADDILLNLSIRKNKEIIEFYNNISKLSIENDRRCRQNIL